MDTKIMQAFEEFMQALEIDNVIRIGRHINDLIGIGTEYLVINGEIIAKFYNGNLAVECPKGDANEKTIAAS